MPPFPQPLGGCFRIPTPVSPERKLRPSAQPDGTAAAAETGGTHGRSLRSGLNRAPSLRF